MIDALSERARETARIAQGAYREGGTDLLRLLDAERVLLQSQDSLAASETRTATSLVSIYKALGGGWESDLDATSSTPAPHP